MNFAEGRQAKEWTQNALGKNGRREKRRSQKEAGLLKYKKDGA